MLNPKKLYVANIICGFFPPTKCYPFKSKLFRWAGVKVGSNVRIVSSARIWGTGELTIDDNTFVGHYSKILMGGAKVFIGRDVDISSCVTIINGTHNKFDIPGKAAGTGYAKNISIGNGVWIGASSTVIGGSFIEEQSLIASGSIVVGTIPTKSTAAGVPAKVIKKND